MPSPSAIAPAPDEKANTLYPTYELNEMAQRVEAIQSGNHQLVQHIQYNKNYCTISK